MNNCICRVRHSGRAKKVHHCFNSASSFCITHTFFLFVKTCHLHYPRFNWTTDSSVMLPWAASFKQRREAPYKGRINSLLFTLYFIRYYKNILNFIPHIIYNKIVLLLISNWLTHSEWQINVPLMPLIVYQLSKIIIALVLIWLLKLITAIVLIRNNWTAYHDHILKGFIKVLSNFPALSLSNVPIYSLKLLYNDSTKFPLKLPHT